MTSKEKEIQKRNNEQTFARMKDPTDQLGFGLYDSTWPPYKKIDKDTDTLQTIPCKKKQPNYLTLVKDND
jgi:hypothetical protein